MKYKIVKEKYGKVNITYGKIPILSLSVQQFIELSNAIVEHVVDKGYKITNSNMEAKAKGFGQYHFLKGFILATVQDIKKKYGK